MNLQERLDALIKERAQVMADSTALLEKDKMTEEENTSFDELSARNKDIKAHIKRLEIQIVEEEEEMNRSEKAPIKPDLQTHKIEINEDARQYKYESLGMQLFDVARFTQSMDRNSEKRLRESRSMLTPEERAIEGLGNMVPAEGGFLVQSDFATDLIKRTHESGLINAKADHKTVGPGANTYTQNYLDETSRADGSRGGGIVAYWKAEGASFTASKFALGRIELVLDKLTALCYATDENLEDATQLESIIQTEFPKEINYKLDDAIINGDGATQPLGYLNAIYPQGMTVSVGKETSQVADTIVVENINKMWNRMIATSRKNAIWLINQDVEYQLDQLEFAVGTGGLPGYLPPGGLSVEGYSSLKGRPVLSVEQCPVLGDRGDIMLVDLSSYLIIEKGGLKTASSIHVAFTTDQQVFRFVYRTNGQPKYASALTAAKGGTARSECVVLAERT